VLGQSGAGKSSLLRAGVIPALRNDGWQIALGTPISLVLPPSVGRLLIVVDQFEELFTTPDLRAEFVDDLFALAAQPDVAVVCGMRADF
jgi:ABC-type cobalamin/Fe3+-siderophores transport system ATPase subunit